jgi:hypothetical protein
MPVPGDSVASCICDKPSEPAIGRHASRWPERRRREAPIVVEPSPKFGIDLPGKLLDGLPLTAMQLPPPNLIPDFLRPFLRDGRFGLERQMDGKGSLPRLLSAAAGGGLEPSPVRRFRGASPHRLLSYAEEASVAASFAHGTLRSTASAPVAPGAARSTSR